MKDRESKVIIPSKLKTLLKRLRRQNKKIVFTNGCFDIIHAGHVRYLKGAKRLGDMLIVGLNSDSSVRKIKGDFRPLIHQKERAEVLSALEPVNYVVIFNETTPLKLIKNISPDVLVKGADWRGHEIVGSDYVKAAGGRIARIRLVKGRSTSSIIKKILYTYGSCKTSVE
ncbi:MAG: glycerol-3-phosphate cytidylyltransferase [Deltaproteobacteria bacterium GWC2_42_11]|nr:MAG: glycerol-3-phosphate cytidylyltransferase [Deltaproteobacteria bacterium GWC2_42_11]HBO84053.1 D-glycero-beta-D-manno-heptose 1-phosphate adenylyltransferase [Deltaproteobacteria bacterium]